MVFSCSIVIMPGFWARFWASGSFPFTGPLYLPDVILQVGPDAAFVQMLARLPPDGCLAQSHLCMCLFGKSSPPVMCRALLYHYRECGRSTAAVASNAACLWHGGRQVDKQQSAAAALNGSPVTSSSAVPPPRPQDVAVPWPLLLSGRPAVG